MMDTAATMNLGWLPHFCLAGYLLFLLGIGLWGFSKRQAGEEDYYPVSYTHLTLPTILLV